MSNRQTNDILVLPYSFYDLKIKANEFVTAQTFTCALNKLDQNLNYLINQTVCGNLSAAYTINLIPLSAIIITEGEFTDPFTINKSLYRILYNNLIFRDNLHSRFIAPPLSGLYNTGINNDNSLIPQGSPEQHWQITNATLITQTTQPLQTLVYKEAATWSSNGPNSQWIAPFLLGVANNWILGTFTYSLSFVVFDASIQNIQGYWVVDDYITDVKLNNISTGNMLSLTTSFLNQPTSNPFIINTTGLLVNGINVLEIVVSNASGPSGLRVEFLNTAFNSRHIIDSETDIYDYTINLNNYIGINEVVSTTVINRCLEQIYNLQNSLLNVSQTTNT